jgi:hypothetical protein
MSGGFQYGFEEESGEQLDADAVPFARRSAARMLLGAARGISELVDAAEGGLSEPLSARLEFARACLQAIESPRSELGRTCPDDGTSVYFDDASGGFCCLKGHCPPGG